MIEIPEVVVLADQINESMAGKRIKGIKIPRSPGRFSFYLGDPNDYDTLMRDSYICGGRAIGGMVEIMADDKRIVFSDGAIPRQFDRNEEPNRKSQLTIEFSDGSFLCVGIQLYGGLWCFSQGGFDNIYYSVAQEKPSPLHSDFDKSYYLRLFETEKSEKLSLKAFLATEQRIPGLGNGTLQDILWTAELHPKAKVGSLSSDDRQRLLNSIKTCSRTWPTTVVGKLKETCLEKLVNTRRKSEELPMVSPALDAAETLRDKIIWGQDLLLS